MTVEQICAETAKWAAALIFAVLIAWLITEGWERWQSDPPEPTIINIAPDSKETVL